MSYGEIIDHNVVFTDDDDDTNNNNERKNNLRLWRSMVFGQCEISIRYRNYGN